MPHSRIDRTHKVHTPYRPKLPTGARNHEVPQKIGKRSTTEKVLRGLTAPVTAPMMVVGGLMKGIGKYGALGPLVAGAFVGNAISHSPTGALIGMGVAGVMTAPIVLASGLVYVIGSGLYFAGGSVLAPDFIK